MFKMKIIYTVVIQTLLIKYIFSLECRQCSNVYFREECDGSVTCSPGEECYMDEKIVGSTIVYEGGCRSTAVCSKAIGKRHTQKRDDNALIACSRCCAFDANAGPVGRRFCNDFLCGLKASTNSSLHECYECKDVADASECNQITTCQTNEVCSTTRKNTANTGPRYSMGCLRTHPCVETTLFAIQNEWLFTHPPSETTIPTPTHGAIVGRREDLIGFQICCGDTLCNTGNPYELMTKLRKLWKAGSLDNSTLSYILPKPSG